MSEQRVCKNHCGHGPIHMLKGECRHYASDTLYCGHRCRPDEVGDAPAELTDAEVDAFLKEHENDPVDEARSERIEWKFRQKLGQHWASRGREYINNYERMLAEESRRTAATVGQLYSGTIELIKGMATAIETLAIKPRADAQREHVDFVFDGMECCRTCGLVKPHDGWKKPCKGPTELTLRSPVPDAVPQSEAQHEFLPTPPRLSDGILDGLCSLCDQPRSAPIHPIHQAPSPLGHLVGHRTGCLCNGITRDPRCAPDAPLVDVAHQVPPAPAAQTLIQFIETTEAAHFRTPYDTGANLNALLVWNLVRRFAGLPRLTRDDLMNRAGYTKEQMAEYDRMKRKLNQGA